MTMTDTTLPADWAIERALAESDHYITLAAVKVRPTGYPAAIAFARYIEKHEQPPVDPWVMQARELAASVAEELSMEETPAVYRAGNYDGEPEVQAIAAALRAAYEKGKAE